MKVLITGATGFIGLKLCRRLVDDGHTLVALVRNIARARQKLPDKIELIEWVDISDQIPAAALKQVDAVIHLAGEPIADRWTAAKKMELRRSRIDACTKLRDAFLAGGVFPKTFISASAIGIYGNRRDEILNERSPPGTDFLANLTTEWEKAAASFGEALGCRVVCVRTGIVLGDGGGALGKMLPIFKKGLGGKLGSGRQWMSWIHLDDLIEAYVFALNNNLVSGPINAVAPNPVQNSEFTKTLAAALKVQSFIPVPAIGLRLVFGEMADVLLGGARVSCQQLENFGFRFEYRKLRDALRAEFAQ